MGVCRENLILKSKRERRGGRSIGPAWCVRAGSGFPPFSIGYQDVLVRKGRAEMWCWFGEMIGRGLQALRGIAQNVVAMAVIVLSAGQARGEEVACQMLPRARWT